MRPRMIFCSTPTYKFEGWTFENNPNWGPWPLKKNGDPRARVGRQFWKIWERFDKLTKDQQEKLRVGGGCVVI